MSLEVLLSELSSRDHDVEMSAADADELDVRAIVNQRQIIVKFTDVPGPLALCVELDEDGVITAFADLTSRTGTITVYGTSVVHDVAVCCVANARTLKGRGHCRPREASD